MSDLCKCGHAKDHHFTPRLGGRCFRHECECVAFEPPAADLHDLAAILAKHDDWINNQDGTQAICDCQSVISTSNSWTECEEAHRAHVAQMVLESDWLRDVKADVLRTAQQAINVEDTCGHGYEESCPVCRTTSLDYLTAFKKANEAVAAREAEIETLREQLRTATTDGGNR